MESSSSKPPAKLKYRKNPHLIFMRLRGFKNIFGGSVPSVQCSSDRSNHRIYDNLKVSRRGKEDQESQLPCIAVYTVSRLIQCFIVCFNLFDIMKVFIILVVCVAVIMAAGEADVESAGKLYLVLFKL